MVAPTCPLQIRQQLNSQLTNFTSSSEARYTKLFLAVLFFFHLLGVTLPSYTSGIVALVPGALFSNFYLWTLLTAGVYETSLPVAVTNIALFTKLASEVERSRGSNLLLSLLLITNISTNVALFFGSIACYAATDSSLFIYQPICGSTALVAACIVAIRQKHADKSVFGSQLPWLEALHYRHVPVMLCTATTMTWAITGLIDGRIPTMYCIGTLYSWFYLRYYAVDNDGLTGDLSNNFSFSNMLANNATMTFTIDVVTAALFHALKPTGVFAAALKSQQQREQAELNHTEEVHPSSNGNAVNNISSSNNSDVYLFSAVDPLMEQRRLRAIARIDQKLAELQRHQPSSFAVDDSLNIDIDALDEPASNSKARSVTPNPSAPAVQPSQTNGTHDDRSQ